MFRRFCFLSLSLVLILSFCSGSALGSVLTGYVFDQSTDAPLRGAHIVLNSIDSKPVSGKIGAITDEEGRFRISDIEKGQYSLSVSYVGYRTQTEVLIVGTSVSFEVSIGLKPVFLSQQDVVITASRAREGETPAAFSNISAARLKESYWVQDIPLLLESVPGMNSYAESGVGIGYTHVRIRGFDERRLGVTINNLPLNDPEEGEVYWVDMPDLASNLEDIQVQRGIGFSSFGTGGFGGSINLLTTIPSQASPSIEGQYGAGSFNTRKWSVALNSGLINDTYGVYGRFSRIRTDGYRDRSNVELESYFLSGIRYGNRTMLQLNVYGGREITHAAWDASAQSDIDSNRRHNPISYENTVDDFLQPHYELHHRWELKPGMVLENGIFYVRGEGYYEQLKEEKALYDFGFESFMRDDSLVETTDFVNQKWVEKDHVGWVPRLTFDHDGGTFKAGGDIQGYGSDHYGYVIWGKDLPTDARPQHKYYRHNIGIQQGGVFALEILRPITNLSFIGDLELRMRRFEFKQKEAGNFHGDKLNRFKMDYVFLNPKFGVNYRLTPEATAFVNLGLSHRAPNDNEYWDAWQGADDIDVDPMFAMSDTVRSNGQVDYIMWSDPLIDPEHLVDIELGAGYMRDDIRLKVNAYWMDFHNEIIHQGGKTNDGVPITDNADRSIHRGLEMEASYLPLTGLAGWMNLTLSSDELVEYSVYDWDENEIDLSGNRIALFPAFIGHGAVGYRTRYIGGWIDGRYVGKQYLDNYENEERTIDPYTVLGLTVNCSLPDNLTFADLELKLRVNNLTDEEYETAGWYDEWAADNFYFVGASRNYFVSLTVRY